MPAGPASTFSYNNRHQVTGIAYGVPVGVAPTESVSFSYDAAGNRTRMNDELGYVSYTYDRLSQLKTETRSFTSAGSYTLSYDYNLAGELKSFTNPWNVQVGYTHDAVGRVTAVTAGNYGGVTNYVNTIQYRAWGAAKQVSYGNTRSLALNYDSRMRLTGWDVPGVMGWQYSYGYFGENTERVTFASSLYDHTLDRSYDYDNLGRLIASHTGREARWHTGQEGYSGADGPYAHNYAYDGWGNLIQRNGWGGANASFPVQSFVNNRQQSNPQTGVAMQYDAAGNLKNDGANQTFEYDATGQQTYASTGSISQSYDGDALRLRKVKNGVTTYYLRSSVLGGQVVAELSDRNGPLQWVRGYVYLGGQILAIQEGTVKWVHQDPVTKSQRLTDTSGAVISTIDLDPWGAETARSVNLQAQSHRYTSYERDANGADEAMMRRYQAQWSRL